MGKNCCRLASEKIPVSCVTRGFAAVFTRAHQWTRSWVGLIHCTHSKRFCKNFSNIISHLLIGPPAGLCSVGFYVRFDNMYTYISRPYAFYMSLPSHNWTCFTISGVSNVAINVFKHTILKSDICSQFVIRIQQAGPNSGLYEYSYNCMKLHVPSRRVP